MTPRTGTVSRPFLTRRPGVAQIAAQIADEQLRAGYPQRALGTLDYCLSAFPDARQPLHVAARALLQLGRAEAACTHLLRLQELDPMFPTLDFHLGMARLALGDADGARKSFRAAFTREPRDVTAHRNFANLRVCSNRSDWHLLEMEALLKADDLPQIDRAALHFALARCFEDFGDFQSAFGYLQAGNKLRRAGLFYDWQSDARLFAAARDMLPAGELAPDVAGGPRPIFIVGLPRSGTTLVEQILSAHARVTAGGELGFWDRKFIAAVATNTVLDADDLRAARAEYRALLRQVAPGAAFVTDKSPTNFMWLGPLRAMFPEAAIVHVRRDRCATAWSNYCQFYSGLGLRFSYDLGDIVRYANAEAKLMAHWQRTVSPAPLGLDYEQLVTAPEATIRALIAGAGLDWDPACLAPHLNPRQARTASQFQVQREIYAGSSEAWKNYRPWLDGQLSPQMFVPVPGSSARP